jgi:hypothetical protein
MQRNAQGLKSGKSSREITTINPNNPVSQESLHPDGGDSNSLPVDQQVEEFPSWAGKKSPKICQKGHKHYCVFSYFFQWLMFTKEPLRFPMWLGMKGWVTNPQICSVTCLTMFMLGLRTL